MSYIAPSCGKICVSDRFTRLISRHREGAFRAAGFVIKPTVMARPEVLAAELAPVIGDVLGKPYDQWTAEQRTRVIECMKGRGIDVRGATKLDGGMAMQFFEEWTEAIEKHSDLREALDPALVSFIVPAGQQFPPAGWASRLAQAQAGPPQGPSSCNIVAIGGSASMFWVNAVGYDGFGSAAARDHAAARAFAQFMIDGFPQSGITAYIAPQHTFVVL